MKRAGTFSSAAGLIFLGIWMIINKLDSKLGQEVFKWWPVIIIFLGIEILIFYSPKKEENKTGFNYLIIPVIIVFLITSAVQSIIYKFNSGFKYFGGEFNFDSLIKFAEQFDSKNYKTILSDKVLLPFGSKIYFQAENADISIKSSQDKNIKIDARIYTDKNQIINQYKINETKLEDGYGIYFNDTFIKKVEVDLYVPEKMNFDIKCSNINIKTDEQKDFNLGNIEIKCNNINGKLEKSQGLAVDAQNLNFSIKDTSNINIRADNCKTDAQGSCENINIKALNGKINIDNNILNSITAELMNGVVDIKTRDKNISVSAELGQGTCTVLGEKRVNSGIIKTIGDGRGKIDVKVDRGVINISSMEW